MIKHNQDGASGALVSLVLTIVLLIGAIAFGIWAFGSRQDYKNNTDAKIADAVTIAKQQESAVKDKQFAEESKNPLTTYSGPQAYGSIILSYPKTWSGYINDTSSDGSSNTPIDGYFHPGLVPSISQSSSVFSLRIQVISKSYSEVVNGITANGSQTPPKVQAYAFPKVPNTVGVKVTGALPISSGDSGQKMGTMVILPLRSQTLELWTETDQYQSDFNKYILPNFTFSP